MRKSTIAGVLAAMAMLLAACGGEEQKDDVATVDGDSGQTEGAGKNAAKELSEEDMLESMRKHARCMRENGIDMPDPKREGHAVAAVPGLKPGEDNSALMKAEEACRSLLPNGGERQELSPELLDEMREQAKCLREHGIDVKDPTNESPGLGIEGDPEDEKFKKAFEECAMDTPGGRAVAVG